MLDLTFPKENGLLQLPMLLRNTPAGKATYTKLALWDTGAEMSGICLELATPVIIGLDIIKQGLFSLEPKGESMHFHYEVK